MGNNLTRRQQYAMAAMQGLLSDRANIEIMMNFEDVKTGKDLRECIAKSAFEIADTMIRIEDKP